MAKKEKVFKVFSHGQRMLDEARISKNFMHFRAPVEEEVTVDETSVVDGVKCIKSIVKKVKLAERDKGLRWFDFSIDSLEYSGAIGGLSTSVLNESAFKQADRLVAAAENIDKNIEDK